MKPVWLCSSPYKLWERLAARQWKKWEQMRGEGREVH